MTEPTSYATASGPRGIVRRALASLLLAGVVALSWTQVLDDTALDNTDVTLKRALAAFAVARAMNGVISVAQGTELAVQPVGVGVTITMGEVLDPLNDLVESFSWLALLACVSLGTQMLLAEVVVNPWINGLLSVGAGAYLIALWWPGALAARRSLLRVVTLVAFARFLFALVTLVTAGVDQAVLAERQEAALSQIELTQEHIEELRENPPQATEGRSESSVLERLGTFLGEQGQALNVRAQLDALTKRVETAIEELIKLFVVFAVQTILIPVAALFLAYRGFLWLWRWSWR